GEYDPDDPNYIKTISYFASGDSSLSVKYYDGLGREIQTRGIVEYNGQEKTYVSGVTEYNARGQATKSYKPYIDLVGSQGLMDYSVMDSVIEEINYYYNGTNDIDLDSLPYSAAKYSTDIESKVLETGLPGPIYCLDSGRTTKFDDYVLISGNDTLIIKENSDPDSLYSITKSHHRGKYSSSVSYIDRGASEDSIIITSYKDALAQFSEIRIDTGGTSTDDIPLRKAWLNDLGQQDSTWRFDYGKIRMIYDKKGNLRFMQNDKRLSENNFVYFKYDNLGRKIEEGIMDSANVYFDEDSAFTQSFPTNVNLIDIGYRWYYDYYCNGSDTILSPGSLVRIENADSSYYRQFYYFPDEYKDSTVVQLLNGRDTKSIVHYYDSLSGDIVKLAVYPLETTANARAFKYIYNKSGNLKSINNAEIDGVPLINIAYITYYYDADNMTQAILGIKSTGDTAQFLNYRYDTRGALIAINDTSEVVAALTGSGEDSSHFAMSISYEGESLDGYFNGRISSMASVNSMSSNTKKHIYNYDYDKLSQLTKADHANTTTYDREYEYNGIGNRIKEIINGTSTKDFYYDSDTSYSRLKWFDGQSIFDTMYYDVLGNLIADTSRGMEIMNYDYRNMLTYVKLSETASGEGHPTLSFAYDETAMRIKKRFDYYYQVICDPPIGGDPGEPLGMMTMMSSEPEDECYQWTHTEQHYLYDNDGTLLAIFDGADNCKQIYVNSPSGLTAVYSNNDDDYLYYFVNDYLGNMRLMLNEEGTVCQYMNYHPYGSVLEGWASYSEPMTYSGKERDNHHDFDFYYFGARYYDHETGQFITADKAAQAASGFMYLGNNPIMGVDPGGNFWFIPALIFGLGIYGGIQGVHEGGYFEIMDGFFNGVATGALIASSLVNAGGISVSGLDFIIQSGLTQSIGGTLKSGNMDNFYSDFGKGAVRGLLSSSRVFGLSTGGKDVKQGAADVVRNLTAQGIASGINNRLNGKTQFDLGPFEISKSGVKISESYLYSSALAASSYPIGWGVRGFKNFRLPRWSWKTLSLIGDPYMI
ncbi:MAG: RHS repeat-associated core domain-containing protein, partial [Candidatus Zixiibacteriota bacterium]